MLHTRVRSRPSPPVQPPFIIERKGSRTKLAFAAMASTAAFDTLRIQKKHQGLATSHSPGVQAGPNPLSDSDIHVLLPTGRVGPSAIGGLDFTGDVQDSQEADRYKGDRYPGCFTGLHRAGTDAGNIDASVSTGLNLFENDFVTVEHRIRVRCTFRIVMEHLGHSCTSSGFLEPKRA